MIREHERCIGKKAEEVFVGNCHPDDPHDDLKDIAFRIGDKAFDINGKDLDPSTYRPLFVASKNHKRYCEIRMAQLRSARNKHYTS